MDTRVSAAHLGLFLAVGLTALALATVVRNRKARTRGAWPLIGTLVCTGAVLVPYALSYSAVLSSATKVRLIDLTYVGWSFMPVAYAVFIARLTGRDRWLTRRARVGLCLIPATLSLLAMSPAADTWFFAAPRDPRTYLVQPGWGYWAFIVCANVALATATVLVVLTVRASRTLHRRQAVLILATVTLPWVLSFASNLNVRIFGSDPTVLTLIVTTAFAYWAAQFRVFDLGSLAKAEQSAALGEGVVVLDATGHVTEMNASAARLLGLGVAPASGRRIEELWARHPAIAAALRGAELHGILFEPDGGDALEFTREPILDARGYWVGHIVIVRSRKVSRA